MNDTPWWLVALQSASRITAIDLSRPVLLSRGRRQVLAFPDAKVVVRVSRGGEADLVPQAEIDFAHLAAAHNIPVIVPSIETVVSVRGAALTFWPLLDPVATFADWGWLGQVVRAIHALPDQLSWRSDPLARVRANLAQYATTPTADTQTIDLLLDRCAEIEERLNTIRFPVGVVHGDAHPGNVIVTSRGPILIDFDLAGHGPTMWDATVPIVFQRRFGLATTDVDRFFRAYGASPGAATEFDVLVDLQELLCASYVAARVAAGADAATELAVRVSALAGCADPSRWTPLR